MDARLRAAERRWEVSGTEVDFNAYQDMRLRLGLITESDQNGPRTLGEDHLAYSVELAKEILERRRSFTTNDFLSTISVLYGEIAGESTEEIARAINLPMNAWIRTEGDLVRLVRVARGRRHEPLVGAFLQRMKEVAAECDLGPDGLMHHQTNSIIDRMLGRD